MKYGYIEYWASLLREASETENDINLHIGLFINQGNKSQRFFDKIMDGSKTIETRKLSSGKDIKNLMEKYGSVEGQMVALISKENSKDQNLIRAVAYVEEIKFYSDRSDFFQDSKLHLINPLEPDQKPTDYDYNDEKGKSGIVLKTKPISLVQPVHLSPDNRRRMRGFIELDSREIMEVKQNIPS